MAIRKKSSTEETHFFSNLQQLRENFSYQVKKKRERGSPWRRPLFGENSFVGTPFTITEILAEVKISLIQEIHLLWKFILLRTSNRKSQLILSNAFSKSIKNQTFTFTYFERRIYLIYNDNTIRDLPTVCNLGVVYQLKCMNWNKIWLYTSILYYFIKTETLKIW